MVVLLFLVGCEAMFGPVDRDLSALNGASASPTATSSPSPKVYSIGDTGPAGGIVFYDAGNSTTYGWRYLECATSDFTASWYGGSLTVTTGTAIGTGQANTTAIIAAGGTSTSYAALSCKNLTTGGYTDWFLPSREELGLLYTNLKTASLGNFSDGDYWSSSQYGYGNEYYVGFLSGPTAYGSVTSPTYPEYVRAIRAF